jgi:hypothetical protein
MVAAEWDLTTDEHERGPGPPGTAAKVLPARQTSSPCSDLVFARSVGYGRTSRLDTLLVGELRTGVMNSRRSPKCAARLPASILRHVILYICGGLVVATRELRVVGKPSRPLGAPGSLPPLRLVRAASCRLRIPFYKRAGFFRDSAYRCSSLVKSKLEESMRWSGFRCRLGSRYAIRSIPGPASRSASPISAAVGRSMIVLRYSPLSSPTA